MSDIPIAVVGNNCPILVELQVVNGRIALDDGHSCSDVSASFFANLKLIYLFLVQYVVERPVGVREARRSPLQCLLKHARAIQVIQATGCPGIFFSLFEISVHLRSICFLLKYQSDNLLITISCS